MVAPEIPDALGPNGERCPDYGDWKYLPPLQRYFPAGFRRRAIEGWAVVRFDVAPWGETGDVEVIASEPADVFGDAAKTIVSQARLPKSDASRIGCVERVRFKLPDASERVQADRD
nr:TonB family protein [Stakelama flava]